MLSNGFWKRVRRYPRAGYLGGVCAGIAHYYDWNVRLFRVLMLLVFFIGGGFPMLVVYVLLWYLMEPAEGRPLTGQHDASDSFARAGTGPTTARPANATELRARFARMEGRLRDMEACVASRDYDLRRELRKLEG